MYCGYSAGSQIDSMQSHEVRGVLGRCEKHMASESTQQACSSGVLVRRRQVEQLVQLSRSSIYAGVAAGTFPAPVRIGARAVAWRLADVSSWVAARPSTSTQA